MLLCILVSQWSWIYFPHHLFLVQYFPRGVIQAYFMTCFKCEFSVAVSYMIKFDIVLYIILHNRMSIHLCVAGPQVLGNILFMSLAHSLVFMCRSSKIKFHIQQNKEASTMTTTWRSRNCNGSLHFNQKWKIPIIFQSIINPWWVHEKHL